MTLHTSRGPARVRAFIAAGAAALSTASMLLLGGCAASVAPGSKSAVAATADVTHVIEYSPIDKILSSYDRYRFELTDPILKLSPTDVAMLTKVDDGNFKLDRFGDTLGVLWSTPFSVNGEGYQSALFRSGPEICCIMTEFGEDDSVRAVIRTFDAETGKAAPARIVDVRSGRTAWVRKTPKRGFSPYAIRFSQDSSRILLFNNDYGPTTSDHSTDVSYNVVMLGRDLGVQYRGTVPFTLHTPLKDVYYGIIPADDGSIIQSARRGTDTIEVTRIATSSARSVTGRFIARDLPGSPSYKIANDIALRLAPNGDAVIALGCLKPESTEMIGLKILRFPASGNDPSVAAEYNFSSGMAERMLDEDEFDSYRIRDVDITSPDHPLVFAERFAPYFQTSSHMSNIGGMGGARGMGSGFGGGTPTWTTTTTEYLDCGPLLIFAFDSSGSNAWRVALKKLQRVLPETGYIEVGHRRYFDRDHALQLLYVDRKQDALLWGRIGVDSGSVEPFQTPLLFKGSAAFLRNYTTWMDDRTVLVAADMASAGTSVRLFKIKRLETGAGH